MSTNGKLADSELSTLSTGGRLIKAAAASFERARVVLALYGVVLRPTSAGDAYRELERQERLLEQNYTTVRPAQLPTGNGAIKYYKGKTWYRRPGKASAATPKFSNHGWGIALDVPNMGGYKGVGFKILAKLFGKFGWDNKEGKSVNEYWHWTYTPANDKKAKSPYKAVTKKATKGSTTVGVYRRRKTGAANKIGTIALGKTIRVLVTWGRWAYIVDAGWVKKAQIKKVK